MEVSLDILQRLVSKYMFLLFMMEFGILCKLGTLNIMMVSNPSAVCVVYEVPWI